MTNIEKVGSNVPVISLESCNQTMVRRIASMLDIDPSLFSNGQPLPRGWHFFMLAGETQKSALRSDGFPGLGVPLPDLGLPRLLLGGRSVSYGGDILIGSEVEKTSSIKSIVDKNSESGPLALVTIQHELRPISAPSPYIVETQTYVLLGPISGKKEIKILDTPSIDAICQKQITPDETMLFQYSALGFNSHKIHLDRDFAQKVDGLPDLVVNGGLVTLLVTEFLRGELKLDISEIKVKHLSPLFVNRPIFIVTDNTDAPFRIKVLDEKKNLAVEIEAK
jgi:3-methylfumaryl-CoA hydratase